MTDFVQIYDNLLSGAITIDELHVYESVSQAFAQWLMDKREEKELLLHNIDNIEAFIKLCNNYYVYSTMGLSLIPDSVYDRCMNIFIKLDKDRVVFPDNIINGKQWNARPHDVVGVVGSLDKVYDYPGLRKWADKYNGVNKFTISPKYDGVSCSIKVTNGKIDYALTRHDGVTGMDITELVLQVKNKTYINDLISGHNRVAPFTGYLKCEICISTKAFNLLINEKSYKNRRSAVSGIVNTPSNLQYARYLSILPLLEYDTIGDELTSLAPMSTVITSYHSQDLHEMILDYYDSVKNNVMEYRIDGIVITPYISMSINENDLMEHSIAYKINTAEAITTIDHAYISIGRTGKAMPMLKVVPCEVNETMVTDVSMGSYDKFLSMQLTEYDTVIVYSAGDVIPQVKLPSTRHNFNNNPPLMLPKECPYCGEKVKKVTNEYYCVNNSCIRLITGRITNFLVKLGADGISDKTVEDIYNKLSIDNIYDFLVLSKDQLVGLDGYGEVSIDNLLNEINRVRKSKVQVSSFFGALGIDSIGEKKCRKIFEMINHEKILANPESMHIFETICQASGIGRRTAQAFVDFVQNNKSAIVELIDIMHVTDDIQFKGNIVMSGFRDDGLSKRINQLGFEVANSVTANTLAVITPSLSRESTKVKSAINKGIPIWLQSDIEKLMEYLSTL